MQYAISEQVIKELPKHLHETHVLFNLDILGSGQELILVHRDTTVETLLHKLIEHLSKQQNIDSPDNFELRVGKTVLNKPQQKLNAKNKPGVPVPLEFARIRPLGTQAVTGNACLIWQGYSADGTTRTEIKQPIKWQPAVIGRSKSDKPDLADSLAFDVAVHLRQLVSDDLIRVVSGRHAEITQEGHQYYIRNISGNPSLRLNNHNLGPKDQRHELNPGDKITFIGRIGKIRLFFTNQCD